MLILVEISRILDFLIQLLKIWPPKQLCGLEQKTLCLERLFIFKYVLVVMKVMGFIVY